MGIESEPSGVMTIADLVPAEAEAGVGLALADEARRLLFFLAGTRHRCPPGELFYAGIGGHREPGEDWVACARREAAEEVGAEVKLLSAATSWHVRRDGSTERLELADRPRPLALYRMVHPAGAPRAGQGYWIVIYQARLEGELRHLPPDEVLAVIALTPEQVIRGPTRRPTLAGLLAEGAALVAEAAPVDRSVRLSPLGTAEALAHLLGRVPDALRRLAGLSAGDEQTLRALSAALGFVGRQLDATDRLSGYDPWGPIADLASEIEALTGKLSAGFCAEHPELVARLAACQSLHLTWGSLQDEIEGILSAG